MTTTGLTTSFRPTFQVPATRGRMGNTNYYMATLPFGAVTKLFTFDPDKMMELTVEERTQREMKRKRIPEEPERGAEAESAGRGCGEGG